MEIKNLKGKRFGKLVVISITNKRDNGRHVIWICKCDCGKIKEISSSWLGRRTNSCGCLKLENKNAIKHGLTKSSTYNSWMDMKLRCYEPRTNGYKNYGGRGIKVCNRWMKFKNFLEDMGKRPEGKTLDRINVNMDYEPSNCQWATNKEQALNKRKQVA